jgi:hypothetical protein
MEVWISEQKCLHKDLIEDQTQNFPEESPVLVNALLGVTASGVVCNNENGEGSDMTPELQVGSCDP